MLPWITLETRIIRCSIRGEKVSAKRKCAWLAVAMLLAFSVPARAKDKILPDACGAAGTEFEIKAKADQPAPGGPDADKAQIVFIVDGDKHRNVRFGVDGSWAGAAEGNSYFVVTVTPGEHHLCADWMHSKSPANTAAFTAEAGKRYYFDEAITGAGGSAGHFVPPSPGYAGGHRVGGSPATLSSNFGQLSEDDGKYRMKAWKFATSKPAK
jgi:hypothetical protein